MNVVDTGHLIEQPTQVKNFKAELYVFHGYSFVRTSNTVIEVWKPCACDNCDAACGFESSFVRTMGLSDEEIQRHGLRLAQGKAPLRCLRAHTSAPILCENCHSRWLKGEALEKYHYEGSLM